MLGGIGSLGYQLVVSSTYTWATFLTSSGLLFLGALCGWGQTKYHRFLLSRVPGVFAARIRSAVQRGRKRNKTESSIPSIEHRGRAFVPLAYMIGVTLLLASSAWAMQDGAMDPVPALLMPWAGFYWGKLFFWRGVLS